jgi:hypothetical protein
MMWESEYERVKKKIKASENIPEGWNRLSTNLTDNEITISKWVPSKKGDCGLKTKECGCNQ